MPKVVPEYKEEAKRRIIEEALKVFLRKGYHQTKMTDIAESLGVSKGAIYQYFKSKEDLFFGVVEHTFVTTQEEMFSYLREKNITIFSSEECFDKMLAVRARYPPSFSIEMLIESARNESFRKKLSKHYKEGFERLIDFLDKFKEKSVIREEIDTRSLAIGLIGLRDGLKSHMLFGVTLPEARKVWVETTKMILNDVLEKT
jgi:AcrR family transcriptional regulator